MLTAIVVHQSWWGWLWGTWWPTIDWGNAPGWVGAVLTSGSLFLAVWILRADRREKRRAAADKLTTWWTKSTREVSDAEPFGIEICAFNGNDAPIAFVVAGGPWGAKWEEQWFNEADDPHPSPIAPAITYRVGGSSPTDFNIKHFVLTFSDPLGKTWYRRVSDNRYISKRRLERMQRKFNAKLRPPH